MAMPIKSDAHVAKLSQREEENESHPTKYFQKIKIVLNIHIWELEYNSGSYFPLLKYYMGLEKAFGYL